MQYISQYFDNPNNKSAGIIVATTSERVSSFRFQFHIQKALTIRSKDKAINIQLCSSAIRNDCLAAYFSFYRRRKAFIMLSNIILLIQGKLFCLYHFPNTKHIHTSRWMNVAKRTNKTGDTETEGVCDKYPVLVSYRWKASAIFTQRNPQTVPIQQICCLWAYILVFI